MQAKKKKKSLKRREAKENFAFTSHTVFSKNPSYFSSLFWGAFALIGGRNERSKFDKAKLKELLTELGGTEGSGEMKEGKERVTV